MLVYIYLVETNVAISIYGPNDRIPINPKLILENMFCRVD